ncbi:MAG TPA: hypothetical protein VHS52_07200 [Acidimicrobiales bacterium]|nr:hypothetical protein [Acidimicrobiales bacterium]
MSPSTSGNAPTGRRWWGRGAAVGVAALLLAGAGAGVGMAVAANASSSTSTPAASSGSTTTPAPPPVDKHAGKSHRVAPRVDPARQAWAHRYGVDRSTMANLADPAAASPDQRAAATDLLARTEAATAQYADLATAKAAGFDLQAALARAEQKKPNKAAAVQRADAGRQTPDAKMPMLHVPNAANRADGKVLDPSAPETLMYAYHGQGRWTLVGVMYTANESYPQAPPDPGGPVTRWHYHDDSGGQGLMMHLFFVPGNDLAHAYAAEMDQ